ncbi:MAG TPA: multidrug efflux RND transporter permease subunit [Azospirillum sp.]|nr:multidrug efflux RND transporter permease subunit [Azospirillum sp.]
MGISTPFIHRPVGTSLLMVGVLLLGIVAYRFLPVASLPQVEFPTIVVSASLPGASPETMASSVATPLERRLARIADVTEITSYSTLGSTSITIQFDLGRDIEAASRDVQAAINAAGGDLPKDLPNPPRLRRINPADAPILVLAVTSDTMAPGDVFNLADTVIGQRLSQVEGVSQVRISGGEKTAVRVRANAAALASMGLSLEDVRTAISQANANGPKGSFDGDAETWAIGADDQLFGADAYRRLIVAERNGAVVRLDAVASVVDATENSRLAAWYNGKRAVLVQVQKQTGANVVETVDRVYAELPTLERWLPPGVHVSVRTDRTPTIRASIHDVQFTLAVTVALVVMVMFLFLRRVSATLIPSAAVPLSLAGTFAAMWACGYSLDNLSLMALTISVGFVVDDAIVVVENVVRHIEAGIRPLEAAVKGVRQVAFTVVSISLSLVAVFIPILFMGGIIGRYFREFAVTLSVAVAVSAFVSLTLTPMMCARLLHADAERRPSGRLARGLERGFDAVHRVYALGLDWALGHRAVMLLTTLAAVAASVWLYIQIPKGFFPQQDIGLLFGTTDAPPDISFQAMLSRQRAIQDAVAEDPAVKGVGSFIGGGMASSTGRLFVTLKPRSEREDIDAVINRLRERTQRVQGVQLFLQPVSDIRIGGRSGKAQYLYALQDTDLAELNAWAPRLVDKLRTLPELRDVGNDQQNGGLQSMVTIDRDAASRLGVALQDIDAVLYDAFGQRQVSTMYAAQNQHHVVLEVDPADQLGPEGLNKVFVKARDGRMVPLGAVASFQTLSAPLSVQHQGQFPVATLSFNLAPGVSLGEATVAVRKAAEEIGMPPTVRGGFAGNAQAFSDSLSTQPLLIVAAVITIYIVLGVLYESTIHPLTILSTLPSAGLGALLALIFTGQDLSIVAMIGIVLLIGIVKKNAIMMIDFALEAERERGLSPLQAIREAALVRFRPIMMTTFAALLGALPLALDTGTGGELRRPLGIAIVGGLLVSQVLTLYSTPVVYLALERLAQRRGARRRLVPAE